MRGWPAMVLVVTAGCGASAPDAARPGPTVAVAAEPAGAVTVVERGAEPRRVLRYPLARRPLVADVVLTWSSTAHATDSHRRYDEHRTYRERTLRGVGVRTGLGGRRALRLAFTRGTAAPELDGVTQGYQVPVDLTRELPFAVDIDVRAGGDGLVVAPIDDWRDEWQPWLYRRAVADAVPAAFPAEAVGVGARWRVVVDDPDQGRTTTTWSVVAFAGDQVSLAGDARAATARRDERSRWTRAVRVRTQLTVDLATFAMTAQVERSDDERGWSGITTSTGQRHERSVLTLAPR